MPRDTRPPVPLPARSSSAVPAAPGPAQPKPHPSTTRSLRRAALRWRTSRNSRGFTAAQFQLPRLKEQAGGRRGTGASLLASPPSGTFCHIHIAQVRNSPHPRAPFLPSRPVLLTCVAPTATLPPVVPSPSHSRTSRAAAGLGGGVKAASAFHSVPSLSSLYPPLHIRHTHLRHPCPLLRSP